MLITPSQCVRPLRALRYQRVCLVRVHDRVFILLSILHLPLGSTLSLCNLCRLFLILSPPKPQRQLGYVSRTSFTVTCLVWFSEAV